MLEDKLFFGLWRSFKVFKQSGAIRFHDEGFYERITITPERQLLLESIIGNKIQNVLKTVDWRIEFKNKKHFLSIAGSALQYEVITVNHTVLVLAEQKLGEKTFYAKGDTWYERLKSNREILL